ncbi:transglutaminase family protein [Frigidibacter sp. ROC022]|uniref:transglutaminase family protein n=1 Tax=Frigidibacter sp. ROC022 TaxID=2971796 RepID=UPI00215B581F|nr:transglutaminase domain-containing protein [Frigidibacter sp. ROC022]MCR8723406.1 transglutaminase family protein [Frigidibacter sp. ROC022]
MKLTVRHATSYSYPQPMRTLVQSVRLFPSRFDGQTVEDWQVSIEGFGDAAPGHAGGAMRQAVSGGKGGGKSGDKAKKSDGPGGMGQSLGGMAQSLGEAPEATRPRPDAAGQARIGAAFRDGVGDWTETVSIRGPVSRVVVTVTGRVETHDLSGVLRGHREMAPPGLYLRSTRATAPDVALTELAREVIAATEGTSTLDRAHKLSEAVTGAIAYAPGETAAHTTAADALAGGKGVCQDHAHAMISLAHLADIPARYVVGYLFAEGAIGEASHAWAELWLDGLGWVGFDPANECCPDDRYIRLCSGYDAQDAAPIRGIAAGASEPGTLEVDVAVQRQGQ